MSPLHLCLCKYRKKNWKNIAVIILKFELWFCHTVMHPKDAARMANSEDPDQTAPNMGLHCLARPVCPKNLESWYLRGKILSI